MPAGLKAIRDNCLAKDPNDRYQNGREILSALRAVKSGERVARRTRGRLSKRIVTGIAATVLAATAAISWIVAARGPTVPPRHAPSIAVLPLRDESGGAESAYFADGVTDALIDRLGTIEGLRVISRTSTSRYRNPTSLGPLRQDLQADVAVRGSVEHASERVRLVLELVDTATEKPVWQQTLERPANEVLALENDGVRAIAERIGAPVPALQQVALRTARAVDPVVYEQYLKGRFYWNKRTGGSLEQAVRFYQSAIERDPTYAPARAALADCYNQLGTVMVGAASPREMRPRAKAEAIEQLFPGRLDELSATLAYHFERAEAREKAIRYLRQAAERAVQMQIRSVDEPQRFHGRSFTEGPDESGPGSGN